MQPPCQRLAPRQELIIRLRRKPPARGSAGGSDAQMARDETKKRGNYDSGEDYVLEYGELREPVSPLGNHVNDRWYDLVGPADRSLVHWLRRLVFRGAWLDQRVKE